MSPESSRNGPASGHPPHAPNSGNLSITESHRGKTFLLLVGDTVNLTLSENPSTGYRWVLTLPEGVDLIRDEYTATQNQVGSGGLHLWEFRVTKPGIVAISGIYRRPWEGISGRERRFDIAFQVEPSKTS